MRVATARARNWWSGVGRHQRLQGSVLGAFAVAIVLSGALLLSAGRLDRELGSKAVQSDGALVLAQSMIRVNIVLETYDGSVQSRTELAQAAVEPSDFVEGGSYLEADWFIELKGVARSIDELVGSSLVGNEARLRADGLAQHQERLFEKMMVDSQRLAGETSSAYTAWYRGVIAVAMMGMLVLALTVAKVILPLSRSIRRSLEKLEAWTTASKQQGVQRKLISEVTDGLDAATSERQAFSVIERTLREITTDFKVEVLLGETPTAQLRQMVVHPINGAPGCGVQSTWSCPAVRGGTSLTFDDSREIRACPHLTRHDEPCSAVCSPLMFMGEPMGVIHATGPVCRPPSDEMEETLTVVATAASTRLGTLRAFAQAEMQAATDVLTGSFSRRASEERMGQLVKRPGSAAVALFEVGGLIELNSRDGKQAGDHALRLFVEVVRKNVRATDWCGRWHGAQFLVVMDGTTSVEAYERLVTTRDAVLGAFAQAKLDRLSVRFGVTDSAGVPDVGLLMSAADAALAVSGDDRSVMPEQIAVPVEQVEV